MDEKYNSSRIEINTIWWDPSVRGFSLSELNINVLFMWRSRRHSIIVRFSLLPTGGVAKAITFLGLGHIHMVLLPKPSLHSFAAYVVHQPIDVLLSEIAGVDILIVVVSIWRKRSRLLSVWVVGQTTAGVAAWSLRHAGVRWVPDTSTGVTKAWFEGEPSVSNLGAGEEAIQKLK